MRNKILVFLFSSFLLIMLLINIFSDDKRISYIERRTLQMFPEFSLNDILDATFFKKFDNYTVDQFIGREKFQKIKAYFAYNILNNYDNNGLYIINNHIFKQEYPYNKNALIKTINKINNVYNKYLKNNQVYYAIIPDKNYFVSDKYLKIDYSDMFKTIKNSFDFKYIDIINELNLNDYYLTDPHIKQDSMFKLVDNLIEGMNNDYYYVSYQKDTLKEFYGSYYGQLGLSNKSDEMVYLTNNIINNAKVYYLENDKLNSVYNLSKYKGMDSYDIYLDGASSFIEIINEECLNDRELVIFRDSFGSSIAPLLIPYYSKITLIDIRYLRSDLLNNYIEFNNQDVLFLYSTLIYNTNILK